MTIDEVVEGLRRSGPTMDVPAAAAALGVGQSTLYAAVKEGRAPVRTIRVLGRVKVLTESVIDLLQGSADVRSRETDPHHRRSAAMPEAGTSSAVKRSDSDDSGADAA